MARKKTRLDQAIEVAYLLSKKASRKKGRP
jgi:hypothetical protein